MNWFLIRLWFDESTLAAVAVVCFYCLVACMHGDELEDDDNDNDNDDVPHIGTIVCYHSLWFDWQVHMWTIRLWCHIPHELISVSMSNPIINLVLVSSSQIDMFHRVPGFVILNRFMINRSVDDWYRSYRYIYILLPIYDMIEFEFSFLILLLLLPSSLQFGMGTIII